MVSALVTNAAMITFDVDSWRGLIRGPDVSIDDSSLHSSGSSTTLKSLTNTSPIGVDILLISLSLSLGVGDGLIGLTLGV